MQGIRDPLVSKLEKIRKDEMEQYSLDLQNPKSEKGWRICGVSMYATG